MGQAVLVLLFAVLVLGQAALILGQAVLVLLLGVLQLGAALVQQALAVGQLRLAALVFGLGVQQRLPAFLHLGLTVGDQLFVVLYLGQAVGVVLLAVQILLLAVGQLLAAVRQFLGGVGQLLVGLGLAVVIFLPAVVDLGLGLAHHLVVTGLAAHLIDGLHPVGHRIHQRAVLVVKAVQAGGALHRQIGFGVIVGGKRCVRHVQNHLHGAAAHAGRLPLKRKIVGIVHDAHHGEGGLVHGVAQIFVVRVQRQRVADVVAAVQRVHAGLHHTLVGVLRPAAVGQGQPVDDVLPFRVGGQGVHTADQLAAVLLHQQVGGFAALHLCHAVHLLQRRHVVLGQAQGGHHTQVKQVAAVQVLLHGILHVRGGGQQPCQEAHTQRHNGKNGDEPAFASLEGAQNIFLVTVCHYHSILSTGVGSGFVLISMTRPLLMRMTRSAMAARALLWVMTMTVRPFCRQVFCKSSNTCLPVL